MKALEEAIHFIYDSKRTHIRKVAESFSNRKAENYKNTLNDYINA